MKFFIDDYTTIRIQNYNKEEIYFNSKTLHLKSVDENNNYYFYLDDEIDLSKDNYIYTMSSKYLINIGLITTTQKFNDTYQYHGSLGAIYTKEKTTFYVFSPVAKEIILVVGSKKYELSKIENGAWSVVVKGNLDNKKYYYLVRVNDKFIRALDPYATCGNDNYSVVCDFSKTIQLDYFDNKISSYTDAVIYEGSIRDMTVSLNITDSKKGLYEGLISKIKNKNINILDYVKDLGITHLQLLPVFDFKGVCDNNKNALYNWGYNPFQYFVLDGFFSKNPNNSKSRINEFKKVIQYAHSIGLSVNMDVVYNHVYDKNIFSYEAFVPNYFFRYKDNKLANGSFCGNEIASEKFMTRRLIVDSLSFFAREYKIDGFRFDLLGLMDVTTAYQIEGFLKKINPNIMLYGEGWNMGNVIREDMRCTIQNARKLQSFAFFNDQFRNLIKGQDLKLGYSTTNNKNMDLVCQSILGSPNLFKVPTQSINYVECHDNKTFYDHINQIVNLNEKTLRDYLELGLALVILSQGIPFIHAGQEFLRSKNGIDNSYRSPDIINSIKWDFDNPTIIKVKELLEIRKKYHVFRNITYSDKVHIHFNKNNFVVNYIVYNGKYSLNIFIKNDYFRAILNEPGNYIYSTKKPYVKNGKYEISKPGIYIFEK